MSIVYDLIDCVPYADGGLESCVERYCETSACEAVARELDECVSEGWLPEDSYATCALADEAIANIAQEIGNGIVYHTSRYINALPYYTYEQQDVDIMADLLVLGSSENPYNVEVNSRLFAEQAGTQRLMRIQEERIIGVRDIMYSGLAHCLL